ncbi:hypothetical protein LT330_007210 [Penicillium expansum]|uniref:gamma-glutamylcyclotransferase n=1 Tax=Penicillium expansum TaxID=27334 RepID=A0A0A2KG97_PENEN|nr:hypothetical protein PEX2_011740 [Penicillium expansum]KAJ5509895.1 hypothetical protein N7453_001998 [Penicillium expansum]KAK4868488.1 hypothetical protein LT330_007210 [Penicillium expansum]KGO40687.1 hypothetical protein PEXP_071860 [Penicillium expansum]KGO63385.1 hypothetical protein PEX2_011740 [Penicillium expansum]KGO70782.1 hypothetical protein PEX1_027120 [Penicillium expansum]
MAADKKGIWYFAYGSNMRSSVMKRRGITALDAKVVVVSSHYLTFDIFGIPYAEPSFASIAAFVSEKVTILQTASPAGWTVVPAAHGVAYLLTPADYRQLVISEGGGVAYDEIEVDAEVLHVDEGGHEPTRLVARSLQAKYPWEPNGAPSARYLVRPHSSIYLRNRPSNESNPLWLFCLLIGPPL